MCGREGQVFSNVLTLSPVPQVKEVDHLPKADTFGKCDPQVEIKMGASCFKTGYKSNTYKASFTEVFEFDATAIGDMEFLVTDHETVGSAEFIGSYVVAASVLQELADIGNGAQKTITVGIQDKKGAAVIGNDKEKTQMRIQLSYASVGGGQVTSKLAATGSSKAQLASSASSKDVFGHLLALQVTINTLHHIPKMDGLMSGGKADPYVQIEYAEQSYQTEVRKGTLSADFKNETFTFEIGTGGEMVFSAFDWDRVGKNELIGRCALGRSSVAALSQGGKGKMYSETLTLKNLKGETVVGNDGANCELSVSIEVVEALRGAIGKKAPGKAADKEKEQFQAEIDTIKKREAALQAKMAKQNQENADKVRVLEAQLRKQEQDLAKIKAERDYSNEVKYAIQSLLPAAAQGNPLLRGQYSDLTIECIHGDEPSECIAAHCCVLWATFAGLRPHVEKAYQLKGKKHHVCDVRGDPEMDALFEFLNADQFNFDDFSTDKENQAKNIKSDDSQKGAAKDHEWNPSQCISVPGTVFGVGYRCTCAHGSFALAVGTGKTEKTVSKEQVQTEEDGGGFIALLRIVGVKPSVVMKVVEIMYGYDMPHFNSDEVLDAILLARFLRFKRLLIILYQQGHFPEWGCALWDSVRIIDSQLEQVSGGNMELSNKWLDQLLDDANEHFKSAEGGVFLTDGAFTLTNAGFLIVLGHDEVNCQEHVIFSAMMEWCRERLRKSEARARDEAAKMALQASECALTPGPEADKKLEILKKKKEALDKMKPTWKSIALPMSALIRYPFISPETLNYDIAMNIEFQKIGVVDKHGLPMVLRAVFHQDGQRMDGWKEELKWTPRRGSKIFSGEWEWLYGPAAMEKDKNGEPDWPVQSKFLELDFPFATENEITDLGLTKLEIFNLDCDGDGNPDLDDMLITFRFCQPTAGNKDDAKAAVQNVTHHQDMGFFDKLKETTQSMLGRQPSKAKLTNDKMMRACRKVALGTRVLRGIVGKDLPDRQIFALGRVRPSALHATGSVVGGRKLRERSDQRLFGRAFIIFASRQQAYDVKLRFEHKPFFKQSFDKLEWLPLKDEVNLEFKLSGPDSISASLQKAAQGKLDLKVVCCVNLPKTDFGAALGFGSTDAFVNITYDGNEFKTQTVKNSVEPQFNETFSLSIMLVDDPGKISFVVMDWDRFSKNDLIGSCEVSASMLKEMCKKMEGEEDLDLVDAKNVPVKGSNKQTAVLRISWQYSGNAA